MIKNWLIQRLSKKELIKRSEKKFLLSVILNLKRFLQLKKLLKNTKQITTIPLLLSVIIGKIWISVNTARQINPQDLMLVLYVNLRKKLLLSLKDSRSTIVYKKCLYNLVLKLLNRILLTGKIYD